ncbi:MAG TPA: hypothetical protein DEA08_01850, partial [Planctomycetes bacterium]|nr:hypothetical protein [Planctomycetota bacterium]
MASSNDRLVLLLARALASGDLAAHQVLPALRELLGEGDPATLAELSSALAEAELESAGPLAEEVNGALCQSARAASEPLPGLPSDLRRGWADLAAIDRSARALIAHVRQRAHLSATGEGRELQPQVRARILELRRELAGHPHPWAHLALTSELLDERLRPVWEQRLAYERAEAEAGRVPSTVHDEEAFLQALVGAFQLATDAAPGADAAPDDERQALRARILDALLAWPTPATAGALLEVCHEEWAQRRACAALSFRFPASPELSHWKSAEVWLRWTAERAVGAGQRRATFAAAAPELGYVWALGHQPQDVLSQLVETLRERVGGLPREALYRGHEPRVAGAQAPEAATPTAAAAIAPTTAAATTTAAAAAAQLVTPA